MTRARRHLLDLTSHAELLRHRNDAERLQLQYAASRMADSATGAAAGLSEKAMAGDPEALDAYRAAVFGRGQARRLLGWDDRT